MADARQRQRHDGDVGGDQRDLGAIGPDGIEGDHRRHRAGDRARGLRQPADAGGMFGPAALERGAARIDRILRGERQHRGGADRAGMADRGIAPHAGPVGEHPVSPGGDARDRRQRVGHLGILIPVVAGADHVDRADAERGEPRLAEAGAIERRLRLEIVERHHQPRRIRRGDVAHEQVRAAEQLRRGHRDQAARARLARVRADCTAAARPLTVNGLRSTSCPANCSASLALPT